MQEDKEQKAEVSPVSQAWFTTKEDKDTLANKGPHTNTLYLFINSFNTFSVKCFGLVSKIVVELFRLVYGSGLVMHLEICMNLILIPCEELQIRGGLCRTFHRHQENFMFSCQREFPRISGPIRGETLWFHICLSTKHGHLFVCFYVLVTL